MHNLLARCTVLALIGGGFAATGDLGHVIGQGRRLIEAHDVPAAAADDPAADVPTAPSPVTARRPGPAPALPAAPADRPPPPAAPADDGRQPFDHRPPATSREQIDVSGLRAGDRLMIWLRPALLAPPLRLVCDVIDPAAGEVLVHGGPAETPTRCLLRSPAGRPPAMLTRTAAVRLHRIGSDGAASVEPLAAGTIAALATGP